MRFVCPLVWRASIWLVFPILVASEIRAAQAECSRVLPEGQFPADARLGAPRTLNSEFPFAPVESLSQWKQRAEHLRRQVMLAAGLWPLPSRTPLNALVFGAVERDDYTVEKVIFESLPGHFVTGNLYRPKNKPRNGEKLPAVLCPHGHWRQGRFNDQGEKKARQDISIGAERWENAGRHFFQACCVQLARMGCIVFHYDMLGFADSVQISEHASNFQYSQLPPEISMSRFFSADADSQLQTHFGLQTWNSMRSVDFLLSLPEVNPERIAVTGASGGGTQTMMLAAIDIRIAAAFPCVMVSTSEQSGCPCENGHYLRIGMGNIEIAGLTAPRPLGLTAANDWTKELRTKGYPDLVRLYEMFGHPERLTATFNTHFEHNLNHVSRCTVYGFINRHFGLGFEEPVLERDFVPLSITEMSVWDKEHPKPTGDMVGPSHEKMVRHWMTTDTENKLTKIISSDHADLKELREVVGTAWELMIGRRLPEAADLDFKRAETQERDSYRLTKELVRYKPAGEELPTLLFYPHDWDGEVVIWVTPEGKSGLLNANGKPIAPVQQLLDAKRAVVAADLFGQGEFTPDGKPSSENHMVVMYGGKEAWHHYSGYTYGYNPPLFIQHVRDLITIVGFVRNYDRKPRRISMVGVAGAGIWVSAARAQLGNAIHRATVDTQGFRFQNIQAQNHADFVPGAVKYGDLSILLALSAPNVLRVAGEKLDALELVRSAYVAARAGDKLKVCEKDSPEAVVDFLLERTQ